MKCQKTDIQGFKLLEWPKLQPSQEGLIYWHIVNFPVTMDKEMTIRSFRKVFDVWQAAMDGIEPIGRVITYESTSDFDKSHIKLIFVHPGETQEVVRREDGKTTVFPIPQAMDGAGGTLAYVPYGQHMVYFDQGENWAKMGSDKTGRISLLAVGLHEIGHVHDLGHSRVKGSVMNPYYSHDAITLNYDDLLGLTAGYSEMKRAIKNGSYRV